MATAPIGIACLQLSFSDADQNPEKYKNQRRVTLPSIRPDAKLSLSVAILNCAGAVRI